MTAPRPVTLRATGDLVGNAAIVTVRYHPSDGSTSVVIENHRQVQTAWFTKSETVALAAALLASTQPAPDGDS